MGCAADRQMQRRRSTIASCGERLVPARTSRLSRPGSASHSYDPHRLWAATGQAALESARLLVIGATATSTSTLKNLVLPGIGHFTVLDPNTVAPADVGNNFFLDVASVGRPKALETSRWLSELNDSVDSAAEVNVRPLRLPPRLPVFPPSFLPRCVWAVADACVRAWLVGRTLQIS